MVKSSNSERPSKPYPEFPLFPHATKRWAKKIRGKVFYFGSWAAGWEKALAKYQEQRDDLHAGRTPKRPGAVGLVDLCNAFLTAKKRQLESGDLAIRTWADYDAICTIMIETFGPNRALTDLRPADFAKLRETWAKKWGPKRLSGQILNVRIVLNFAYKTRMIEAPIWLGESFNRPSRKRLLIAKNERGPMMFQPEEIRRLLAAAIPSVRAMILLGLISRRSQPGQLKLCINGPKLQRSEMSSFQDRQRMDIQRMKDGITIFLAGSPNRWHILMAAMVSGEKPYRPTDVKTGYPGDYNLEKAKKAKKGLNEQLAKIGINIGQDCIIR